MENLIKTDIYNFLTEIENKYGFIPKSAHNLNPNNKNVYYAGPYFGKEELSAAIESLLFDKWTSGGTQCNKFESEYCNKINDRYGVFVNSGSSANLIMMAALKEYFKWNNTAEIILSPCGFSSTLSAITLNNLKPVFVDIEYNETLNFDLNKIQEKITKNTKAIFLSPVLGNPVDMDKLLNICEDNHIELISDLCDSPFSKYNNKYLNEYSLASTCSFYQAHILSTLEGGIITSNNKQIINIARCMASWGRGCYCLSTTNLTQNGLCGKRNSQWIPELPFDIDHKYFFQYPAYNLKNIDILAAIGREQLKKADLICKIRKENKDKIQELFSKYIKGIRFPISYEKSEWIPFGVPIICNSYELKSKLCKYLESNRLQTRSYFAGNLLIHPAYKEYKDEWENYPNSNRVLKEVFFVGCSPTINQSHINYIEEVLKNFR